jgi:uridine kinase
MEGAPRTSRARGARIVGEPAGVQRALVRWEGLPDKAGIGIRPGLAPCVTESRRHRERRIAVRNLPDTGSVAARIAAAHHDAGRRSVLAAITGVDGSGKGYVTARVAAALERLGIRVAAVNVDGWLDLPHVRFDAANPAEHFYLHAIRFEELFSQLVLPLRDRRSVRVEADFAEEMATAFRRHTYVFEDIDVLLLEGIYLLKRAYRDHYDLSFWLDCSFETALERAIARGQEGLSPGETVHAYRTIYFPAQEIHFQRDAPRAAATAIVVNDSRLLRA